MGAESAIQQPGEEGYFCKETEQSSGGLVALTTQENETGLKRVLQSKLDQPRWVNCTVDLSECVCANAHERGLAE